MTRRVYLDWLRGAAVVIMIEAHTVDSWTRPADKALSLYQALQFVAGWAAPLFLFLAGVSMTLSGAAKLRSTRDSSVVGWTLQQRGWQVFALGVAMRVYSFVLAPGKPWDDIFSPDVLNVMGLALVIAAFCWSRGQTSRSRLILLTLITGIIVVLAGPASTWRWPVALPARLEAYLRINGAGAFALFPWAAFVTAGAVAGEWIVSRQGMPEGRLHGIIAAAGVSVVALGLAGASWPALLPGSHFWTTSISWFLIRIGGSLVAITLAWIWALRPTSSHWSPMVLFGRTSLFVYWIHVEMVYGFMTYPLRARLTIGEWAIAYVLFTALMLGAALLWARRSDAPLIPAHLRAERGGRGINFELQTSNFKPWNTLTMANQAKRGRPSSAHS